MLPPVRGPFCVVRRRPKFLGIFRPFCTSPPQKLDFCGDRIAGSPGFFHVCVQYLYSLIKFYRKIKGVKKCKCYVLQVE